MDDCQRHSLRIHQSMVSRKIVADGPGKVFACNPRAAEHPVILCSIHRPNR